MTGPFLAVLPSFAGGGAERVTLAMINSLAERGIACHLAVFDSTGPFRISLSAQVGLHDLDSRRLRNSFGPLLGLIWKLRPTVVYSTFGYVNLLLLAIRWLFPKGVRLWIREANLPSLSLPNTRSPRLTRLGYWLLYRFADLVICSSQRMRAELASYLGAAAYRARVLPNPVTTGRRHTIEGQLIDTSPNEVVFLACGRLTYQKGFDRLIDMFATLDPRNQRLWILGDGPLREELEERAKTRGVADRVRFLGFQASPEAYFLAAEVLLMPSRWEGMPNVALEALAYGLPVIATPECGGLVELAETLPPGVVVIASAEAGFATAMAEVKPSQRGEGRRSLVPDQHRLESVVDILQAWLNAGTA